jgi:hypothetical protein
MIIYPNLGREPLGLEDGWKASKLKELSITARAAQCRPVTKLEKKSGFPRKSSLCHVSVISRFKAVQYKYHAKAEAPVAGAPFAHEST